MIVLYIMHFSLISIWVILGLLVIPKCIIFQLNNMLEATFLNFNVEGIMDKVKYSIQE